MNKEMNIIIKVEELAITVVAIWFLSKFSLGLPVWLWVLLFFSPDISMLGYLVNTKVGAICYNLFHHRALALAIVAAGIFTHTDILASVGLLLFAHSSFDRLMGYGLKFDDDFKHTHLGWMAKK